MFSGVGGFELAIQRTISEAECIGFSEIDKYAIQIYNKHFPTHNNYGDATKINSKQLPDFDLLVGGFPCQAFSVAGKRKGFSDTRGTLFFDIARILEDKRPRYFILENVKGLLSHDGGKTIQTIFEVLSNIGYGVQWQVLNSKNFGVPQNRERIFIIGYLRGEPRPEIFPFTGGHKKTLEQIIGGSQGSRVYKSSGVSVTIASQAGGLGAKTGLYAIPVLTPDRINKRQNGRRFKTIGEPAFTLTGQDRHGVTDGIKIRRLTPLECCRLQGFPDNWVDDLSDTQKYKCLGNAVTVNVVEAILKKWNKET